MLIFIRHAQAEGNSGSSARLMGWHDAPLSLRGWAEVFKLRERLSFEPSAAAVYTSPLRRALDTARAAPPDLPCVTLESLREISCGVVDGKPLAEVQTWYPELWQRNFSQADESFRWPGGESYREFRSRVLETVNAIALRHSGERVYVVTHAGVINQVIGSLAGICAACWEPFRPSNASMTEVRWNGPGSTVVRFDDRSHLL